MWLKLDDGFATHPKILKAGPLALALQVRAICYASHHQTDGYIPTEALPYLTVNLEWLPEYWTELMVLHGLWEPREHGYYVHDYLEWNVSKRQLLASKKQKSLAGKKGMKTRWTKPLQPITHVITPVNNTLILSSALHSPDQKIHLRSKSYTEEFEQFWSAYPKKIGKKAAQKAFQHISDRPAISTLLEALAQAKKSYQWSKDSGQFIPYPVTWLNQGRWDDQACEVKGRNNGSLIPPFPGPEDPIGRGRWRQAYGNDPANPRARS